MRTNIIIDDTLMADVLKATGVKSKREAVELGLKALLMLKQQEDIKAFKDMILAEVLQGFRQDPDYQAAKTLLCSLPVHAMLGATMALKSAENFRKLRQQGITVRKTIDTMIATYCIEHELLLLHSDKNFLPFQQFMELQVV